MIVIGTTIAPFAMDHPDIWGAWLRNAQAHKVHAGGHRVQHFAAIQVDGRGLDVFAPFIEALEAVGGEYWTYSLDDGRTRVTMTNRWRHIAFGENMVFDYAQAIPDCTHVLFVAADTMPPDDILPRLLEMNTPLCGPFMPTYNLMGRRTNTNTFTEQVYPDEWGVEEAMASAACILIERRVFRQLRWRWDAETGMSDDPCMHWDAQELLGIPTYVRHDVVARHFPEAVSDYESRGFDTTVVR